MCPYKNFPKRKHSHAASSVRVEGRLWEETGHRVAFATETSFVAGKFFYLRVMCSGMCKEKHIQLGIDSERPGIDA